MTDLPLPEWFLRWLSVDVGSLEGGSANVRFARFPDGELGLLVLLGIALALGFVVAVYLREGAIPTWRKLVMAGLRGLLVLVTAVVVLYPVLEINRARDLRATTLVLVDDSASFGQRDRYSGAPEPREKVAEWLGVDATALAERSRSELAEELLERNDRSFLRRLRRKNLLEIYTYSDQLRKVGGGADSEAKSAPAGAPAGAKAEAGRPAPSEGSAAASGPAEPETAEPPPLPKLDLEARGTRTDLAGPLRAAVERQGGRRVAAVIVLGDGRINSGEGVSGVAELLRERGIPVHAVGIGDPSPARNLRVTNVLASERVFSGDPVTLDVHVRQQGYEGESVRIELSEEFEPSAGGPVATRALGSLDVRFPEDGTEASVHHSIELQGIGRHRVSARIEPRDEELFADDNQLSIDVEVIEEASRVLLIAGQPSWEYRFLKNLLRRDRRVFLAAWLQSADADYPQEGNVSLERLPADAKELFEYDVVLLLDASPAGLPAGYPELLQRFVTEHRGGLMVVAGELNSIDLLRGQATRPIAEMLPVVPDVTRAEALRSSQPFHESEWPLLPTRVASTHPATRLSSRPENNRERWAQIASTYWSFPVRKAKPGATVLLTHADPSLARAGEAQPVLVSHYFGGGRVLWLGTDETWRWRSTAEEVYDQFWVQTVRYLTETRLSGGKRRLLQADSETYDLGDVARISALLLDENFHPLEAEKPSVSVEDSDGEQTEVRLDPDPTAPGWYRGVYVPRRLGDHRLSLPSGEQTRFRVEPPDLEFQDPRLDEAPLRELAERTGGSFAPIWEADGIPERIPDRRHTLVTTDEPISLWDNWFVLSLLSGLLTLEWIVRKLNRLL